MHLITKGPGSLLTLLGLLANSFLLSARPSPAQEEARAVWFSRFEYGSEADIRRQIASADSCHCNIILFQIRGQADAYYLSQVEPWSDQLGGGYPGFDPLAVAIEEARLRGMELHAYVNTFPLWNGSNPPSSPDHIYNAHPEWVMLDQSGTPMDPAGGYAYLSPGISQAVQHVKDVISDIATHYDIDGIHLDYIRYPGTSYSHDDSSLARFLREYGGTPQELPDQWKQFRRNLVTQFVGDIYQLVTGLKPWVKISAAVWGEFYDGYTYYYQDSHGWLEQGYLDFSAPMIYTGNTSTFGSRLRNHVANSYGRHVYAGIGIYLSAVDPATMLAEVDISRDELAPGQAMFAVSDLSSSYRLALTGGPYADRAEVPVMSWKEPRPFTLSVARSVSGIGVDVLFNRQVQAVTAENEANYSFDNGLSLAPGESVRLDSANPALVHLTTTSQTDGTIYTLMVTGVQDLEGQTPSSLNASRKFVGQAHSGVQVVVDNSDPEFSTVGSWARGSYGSPYGSDYCWVSAGSGNSATWNPNLPNTGTYDVYAYWVQGDNRAPDVPYIIHHTGGADTVRVDQQQNGERWNKLGSYTFEAGTAGDVTITNEATSGVIVADAVRLVEVFTAVPLVHLAAREQNGQVVLSWILDPDIADIGCNLYRDTSPHGPFRRLNDRLLSGRTPGEYVDSDVCSGNSYFYLLGVLSGTNREKLYGPVEITLTQSPLAKQFALDANYPNPFNASTRIRFAVPPGDGPLPVSLKIYNVLGQEVRTLLDEVKGPGQYAVWWDGRDKGGREAASGVYFCRLRAGKNQRVRKMLLVR